MRISSQRVCEFKDIALIALESLIVAPLRKPRTEAGEFNRVAIIQKNSKQPVQCNRRAPFGV